MLQKYRGAEAKKRFCELCNDATARTLTTVNR